MTEDKFQRIRSDYRGFGMVVYSMEEDRVVGVGNTRQKLSKQLDGSEYSLTDDNIIILRCDTHDFA